MIAYGNPFAETGWLNFLFFTFQWNQCVSSYYWNFIQVDEMTGKNPKAVYFVVIVTTDSLFFPVADFFCCWKSIRDFTFDVNFICVTMYIYQLTVLFAFCNVTIEIRTRPTTEHTHTHTHTFTDRQTERLSESEKMGCRFFFFIV